MSPRPRHDSISQAFLPHPSAPQVPLSLPDLPLAAVGRLLAFLSNEDILNLTTACRRLNRKVTTKFFELYGIRLKAGDDSFETRSLVHDAKTFAHLRISPIFTHMICVAFEVDRLLSIYFKFRLPAAQLLRDVHHLSGVISRVGSLKNVTLDFGNIDNAFTKASTQSTTLVAGSFDADVWKIALGSFLDTARKKGIPTVSIQRGREIKQLYTPETASVPQGVATSADHVGQIASESNLVAPYVEPGNSTKEMSLASPIPTSTRRTFFKLQSFKRILSRPSKNPPIIAAPKPPPAPPSTHWAELPPLSSVTTQTGIAPRPSRGRHDIGPGLHTLRADSTNLLSFHHRSLIGMIGDASSTLTILSLHEQLLDTVDWKDILQQINLPRLRDFKISSQLFVDKEGAAVDDLINFFRRHRTITHLTMHGMHLEDQLLTHIPDPPLLPALEELSAHPWYAAMIVKSHVLGTRDSCWVSPLRSISLTREEYSPYHKRYSSKGHPYATTCNEFEHVFDAISLLPVDESHGLILGLGFAPTDQNHEEWMSDHLKRGSKSVICRMNGVRRLVLKCRWLGNFTQIGLTKILPAFVNLFPGLRELEFGEFGFNTEVPKDISKQLKKKCPQLYKIMVDDDSDLFSKVHNNDVGSVGPQATSSPVADEFFDTTQQAL